MDDLRINLALPQKQRRVTTENHFVTHRVSFLI